MCLDKDCRNCSRLLCCADCAVFLGSSCPTRRSLLQQHAWEAAADLQGTAGNFCSAFSEETISEQQ